MYTTQRYDPTDRRRPGRVTGPAAIYGRREAPAPRASIINGGGRGMRHNRRRRARREVMSVSPDPPIVSSSRRLPARPLHAGLTLV